MVCQRRATVALPSVRGMPRLGYLKIKELWRGVGPASADCQIALPGRANNPGGPGLPTGNQIQENDNSDTPHGKGEVGKVRGDSSVARGGGGLGQTRRGGRAGPALRMYVHLSLVFVKISLSFPLLETHRTIGFCSCVDGYRSGIKLGEMYLHSHCWQSPFKPHVAG